MKLIEIVQRIEAAGLTPTLYAGDCYGGDTLMLFAYTTPPTGVAPEIAAAFTVVGGRVETDVWVAQGVGSKPYKTTISERLQTAAAHPHAVKTRAWKAKFEKEYVRRTNAA
jgi:hypothetical protein